MSRFHLTRALLILSFIISLTACKKEPDLLGLDLIPEEELLNHAVTDTITINAFTVLDTLFTRNTASSLLGSINDPVFGITTASFYTQFRLPVAGHDFGTEPVVDSIFLTIPYKGIYGDKFDEQTIRIYEVTDSISSYVDYFQYSTLPVGSELVGEATFIPNTVDSVYIDTVKVKPLMRIALTNEFGTKLINASPAVMKNDSAFLTVFKGLYLVAEDATSPVSGSIMYLDQASDLARIHMYYRYKTSAGNPDTTKFVYLLSTVNNRFNHFEHDYSTGDPALVEQLNGNTSASGEKLFLQSTAGTKIRLDLPYIENLANRKLAIHEAAIVMDPIPDDKYSPAPLLAIREVIPRSLVDTSQNQNLSTTLYRNLADESEGSTHIDGNLKNKQYKFRITRYLQQRLLNPEAEDYPLVIYIAGGNTTANRSVIKGTGAEIGPMKLVLYYTPLD